MQWRETQDKLKMEMLRRQFGIAEPIRRGMELKTVKEGEWKPAVLGGTAGVHRDILEGRDCEIGWEDVFTGKSPIWKRARTQQTTCGLMARPIWIPANIFMQATSSARFPASTPRWRRSSR